jgi:hypothetical protein
MAGRGFGKTRAGAEWVRWLANGPTDPLRAAADSAAGGRIALVGDTFDDVRHVMVEGPSGILAVCPPHQRPQWYRSQRQLVWSSGVVASCFSAADPEQLRGPEFAFAWADEIAKWAYPSAWDNLMLALRTGLHPRALATTTPRPKTWLSQLAAAPDTALVQGSTAENEADDKPASAKTANSEMGLAFDSGPWLVSFVQITSEKTPNKKMTPAVAGKAPVYVSVNDSTATSPNPQASYILKTAGSAAVAASDNLKEKQSASEFEVAYDVSDNLTVNLVVFDAKVSEGKNKDDKYSSNAIGAKYTIAPGLYVSLAQTSFKYTDNTHAAAEAAEKGTGNNKGNGLKLRVNVDL